MQKRIQPLIQGDLDGLCGVYATINAVRWLCPEADSDDLADDLFRHLVRVLEDAAPRPFPLVWQGLTGGMVRQLLTAAIDYMRRTMDITLEQNRVRITGRPLTLPKIWEGINLALEDGSVCVIALQGRVAHWSVAVKATPKLIHLLDSNDLNLILRTRCTIADSKRRIQLVPDQITKLDRRP